MSIVQTFRGGDHTSDLFQFSRIGKRIPQDGFPIAFRDGGSSESTRALPIRTRITAFGNERSSGELVDPPTAGTVGRECDREETLIRGYNMCRGEGYEWIGRERRVQQDGLRATLLVAGCGCEVVESPDVGGRSEVVRCEKERWAPAVLEGLPGCIFVLLEVRWEHVGQDLG